MMHGGIFRYRRTAGDDDTEKWGDMHGRDPYKKLFYIVIYYLNHPCFDQYHNFPAVPFIAMLTCASPQV